MEIGRKQAGNEPQKLNATIPPWRKLGRVRDEFESDSDGEFQGESAGDWEGYFDER